MQPDGQPLRAACETVPPDRAEYRQAVKEFLSYDDGNAATRDLKDVREFTAWNEPNLVGVQPLGELQYARLAGELWRELAFYCRPNGPVAASGCRVAAGDFLDTRMGNISKRNAQGQFDTVGGQYYSLYRQGMGGPPRVWAWHAYTDTENTLATARDADPGKRYSRYRSFVERTKSSNPAYPSPRVWLTEQGVVRLRPRGANNCATSRVTGNLAGTAPRFLNQTALKGRTVMQRLLDELPEVRTANGEASRAERLYYYHARGSRERCSRGDKDFDAGLLSDRLPFSRRAVYRQFCQRSNPDSTDPRCA